MAGLAALSFALCGAIAHVFAWQSPDESNEATQHIARSWGNYLVSGANKQTPGWKPEPDTVKRVDNALARERAAFLLLDNSNRVLATSARLKTPGQGLALGPGRFVDIAPLGRVETIRVPLEVFGQKAFGFVLLSSDDPLRVALAPGASTFSADAESIGGLSWLEFLLIGCGLSALIAYLTTYFVAGRPLRNLSLRASRAAGARRPSGRRLAAVASDEVADLATAVASMRRRTQRSVAALTQRENLRRDWLAELSHDLRTPLAALGLRLENAAHAETFEQQKSLVLGATQDCERIQTLAAGFMDLAKLEVTEDYAPEPVMPEELVDQAVRVLRPIAQEAGVRVKTDVQPQETIWADGHRLMRALENVLRNAIRHARTQVLAGVRSRDGEIHFLVRDDGDGFTGLEPGQPTPYGKWRGRHQAGGLGLRVADRVLRAHGGRLVLRNEERGALVSCIVEASDGDDLDLPESDGED